MGRFLPRVLLVLAVFASLASSKRRGPKSLISKVQKIVGSGSDRLANSQSPTTPGFFKEVGGKVDKISQKAINQIARFLGPKGIDANIQTERTGVDKKAQTNIFSGYQSVALGVLDKVANPVQNQVSGIMQRGGKVVKPIQDKVSKVIQQGGSFFFFNFIANFSTFINFPFNPFTTGF
ncbi:hypothetical protein ANCCAN_15474 [Ancylostoma caninum]|uniref:SXP/RAL-2 family protein Ani s 5-like cation-binding domain-containing protein n=1 Tax=Ancylostoma caninum TaxID=29170 RepID=A0A368G6I2_ANCCA|nr:hypothetical protein ANCCAN_15474 [Ancylostoma caninum]